MATSEGLILIILKIFFHIQIKDILQVLEIYNLIKEITGSKNNFKTQSSWITENNEVLTNAMNKVKFKKLIQI